MTLEVLSSPVPSDRAQKKTGRSTGEMEGGTDGFSSALSKAGRGASSDEKAAVGEGRMSRQTEAQSEDAPVAEGTRRSVKTALNEAGEQTVEDHNQTSRASVSSVFPTGKGQVQRNSQDSSNSSPGPESDGAEVVADDDAKSDKTEATGETGGAADLLSILSGLNSATAASAANAGSPRSAAAGDGRRAAVGESASKTAAGADADTTRKGASAEAVLDMPSADEPHVKPERDFKFINAKNGSINAELTQAAQGNERAGTEAKTGPSSVENVLVLDSRRIVGLPNGSNSASIMAAMVGDQSWSSAMQPDATLSNTAAQSSSGSVVHMLKLQMNPHALGAVTATLKMSGEQLHVHLTVETRAALQQLSDDSSGMLDALRAQGFSVDQVTISVAPTADTDSQKGQQGAQNGQQMAGNGERQSGANRDQSGQRFEQTGDNRNFDNDSSLDTSAAIGPGAASDAHAGQLYL
jgi:chemotaxis protein MotD